MSREVRKVPENWEHPKRSDGRYIPLFEGYNEAKKEFTEMYEAKGLQETLDWLGSAPNTEGYMPEWNDEEKTHFQMYEITSKGTPKSPPMPDAESLAKWLFDNNASSFGSMTATYEQWLSMINAGWAPSAIVTAS